MLLSCLLLPTTNTTSYNDHFYGLKYDVNNLINFRFVFFEREITTVSKIIVFTKTKKVQPLNKLYFYF